MLCRPGNRTTTTTTRTATTTLNSAATSQPAPGPEHGHGVAPRDFPVDAHMGRASPLKIGMWIFLICDAFSFGGLLLAYGVLRGGAAVWWPQGEPALGINFTAGLTFLLICSSVTMVLAVVAAQEGRRRELLRYLGLTIFGGVLFLTGQFHEYFGIASPGLIEQGLVWGKSARATTFFLVTSFHGFHVLSGVILLTVMWLRAAAGKHDGGNYDAIEVAGLFWHFVDLVWILVFTFVYLIPAHPGG
jgi:cytochrome c oxidase subunit 3